MTINSTKSVKTNNLASFSTCILQTVSSRKAGAHAIVASCSEPKATLFFADHLQKPDLSTESSAAIAHMELASFCFEIAVSLPAAIAFAERCNDFAFALMTDLSGENNQLLFQEDAMRRFPCTASFACAELMRRDLCKALSQAAPTVIVEHPQPSAPLNAWIKTVGAKIHEFFAHDISDEVGEAEYNRPTSSTLHLFLEVQVQLDGKTQSLLLIENVNQLKRQLSATIHSIIKRSDQIVRRKALKSV